MFSVIVHPLWTLLFILDIWQLWGPSSGWNVGFGLPGEGVTKVYTWRQGFEVGSRWPDADLSGIVYCVLLASEGNTECTPESCDVTNFLPEFDPYPSPYASCKPEVKIINWSTEWAGRLGLPSGPFLLAFPPKSYTSLCLLNLQTSREILPIKFWTCCDLVLCLSMFVLQYHKTPIKYTVIHSSRNHCTVPVKAQWLIKPARL
jgi:hypothetical protein